MTPEKPKRRFWVGHSLEPRPKIPREDPPEREAHNENLRRGLKKKYFEPPTLRAPTLQASTLWASTLRLPPFGRALFLVLGTHPLDPTPKLAQSLVPAPPPSQKKTGHRRPKKKKKQKKNKGNGDQTEKKKRKNPAKKN